MSGTVITAQYDTDNVFYSQNEAPQMDRDTLRGPEGWVGG